jgi:regulator of sirC expression with transglutaminase-like and TPR domain
VRNSDIAELLARAAEHAKQPLQRALRRAARRAFLWPEEAEEIHARGETLTVLSGIGPYVNKQIIDWLEHPPQPEGAIPEIRHNFLTLAEARNLTVEISPALQWNLRRPADAHALE